jgi:hypothetical protein
MATWSQPNGGKFGKAEWLWLDWMLRGNETSKQFFTGGGAQKDGWSVVQTGIEQVKAFPPL